MDVIISSNENFFDTLKSKLIKCGISDETASEFCSCYKHGLSQELRFENDTMPNDDRFKTLFIMHSLFYKSKDRPEISTYEIRRILDVSYEKVCAVKNEMMLLFKEHKELVNKLFDTEEYVYYLAINQLKPLYAFVSQYTDDDVRRWDLFKHVLQIGLSVAEERVAVLKEAIPEKTVPEVVYETGVNGFLFYPYYNEPKNGILYLKERFDKVTIAKILVENLEFLYFFKEPYYCWYGNEKSILKEKIENIVAKYE